MSDQTGHVGEWIAPLAFSASAAWVVWHGPAYIMALGGYTDALAARYPQSDIVDWVALCALPFLFVIGCITVRHARMEYPHRGALDNVALFIGRVTMLIVVLLVTVMMYEVFVRYVLEKPTIWANELSLWMAGFIFVLAGLYAMQQRSHIRIYLLYDLMPRWLQRICDTISTLLICLFAFFLIYGGWGEAKAKFLRWETFGTAFDPPIPATEKPLILLAVTLVAIQAVLNLIRDWNLEPEIHTDEPDQEELEALMKAVGVDGIGDLDVTRGQQQNSRPG